MSIWYYDDVDGRKQGPYSVVQLRWFVKQGAITPETMVMALDGETVPAGKVSGLTFPETPPTEPNPFTIAVPLEPDPFTVPIPQSIPVPIAEGKKSWLWIRVVGALVLLTVGGIGGALMLSGKNDKPNKEKKDEKIVEVEAVVGTE